MVAVYLLLALLGLSLIFQIVQTFRNSKEVKEMTVSKFKEKVNCFVEKKDGAGLSAFVKRNFVFILTHGKELDEFVRELRGNSSDSVENNKGGKNIG